MQNDLNFNEPKREAVSNTPVEELENHLQIHLILCLPKKKRPPQHISFQTTHQRFFEQHVRSIAPATWDLEEIV